MTGKRVARSAYTVCYADPISVRKGDLVNLSGRQDNWDGHVWNWAQNSSGKQGWIPDDLLAQVTETQGRAVRDYSAVELSCAPGEVLTVHGATHGLLWCENNKGEYGWVPENCFAESD